MYNIRYIKNLIGGNESISISILLIMCICFLVICGVIYYYYDKQKLSSNSTSQPSQIVAAQSSQIVAAQAAQDAQASQRAQIAASQAAQIAASQIAASQGAQIAALQAAQIAASQIVASQGAPIAALQIVASQAAYKNVIINTLRQNKDSLTQIKTMALSDVIPAQVKLINDINCLNYRNKFFNSDMSLIINITPVSLPFITFFYLSSIYQGNINFNNNYYLIDPCLNMNEVYVIFIDTSNHFYYIKMTINDLKSIII